MSYTPCTSVPLTTPPTYTSYELPTSKFGQLSTAPVYVRMCSPAVSSSDGSYAKTTAPSSSVTTMASPALWEDANCRFIVTWSESLSAQSIVEPSATTVPPFTYEPMSESRPESDAGFAMEMTVPPLMTSQPFESTPSPSEPRPATMCSVPPLMVVTETPSSFVLMPSSCERMEMLPPLMVRCSSESRPSLSATMASVPVPCSPPFTFMDMNE